MQAAPGFGPERVVLEGVLIPGDGLEVMAEGFVGRADGDREFGVDARPGGRCLFQERFQAFQVADAVQDGFGLVRFVQAAQRVSEAEEGLAIVRIGVQGDPEVAGRCGPAAMAKGKVASEAGQVGAVGREPDSRGFQQWLHRLALDRVRLSARGRQGRRRATGRRPC